MCVSVCMCVCSGWNGSVGRRLMPSSSLNLCSHYFLRQSLSLNLELFDSGRLAVQQA